MVAAVEHRDRQVNRVRQPIEWLTDNGSCYTARDTGALARYIGLVPRTTPVSSPQSNGMAEASEPQARLCPGEPQARCQDRYQAATRLDRP
jgi:transposase InsO family protein